jgi:hypothetical protein
LATYLTYVEKSSEFLKFWLNFLAIENLQKHYILALELFHTSLLYKNSCYLLFNPCIEILRIL